MIDDIDTVLEEIGFDPDETVLTHRQAQILALRERGETQSAIADELGTSRANVSSIESSARENLAKAEETVAVVEALRAPVTIQVEEGTDLYDVPRLVYEACDEVDVKVPHDAPGLMKLVSDAAGTAVDGRHVRRRFAISVTPDGAVKVRGAGSAGT